MAGTGTAHLRPQDEALLTVKDLVVEFPSERGGRVHAVSGIGFDLLRGETLGLVGESGCGKSSVARAVLQLPPPTSGSVLFRGLELTKLSAEELRRTRIKIQMIFQDPLSSLNPRRRVRALVAEGLDVWHLHEADREERVDAMLDAMGLDPAAVAGRRPLELSGGQCQRVCIARALIMEPDLLICDEPVSRLDVSIQAQIVNLLRTARASYGVTILFIAHDLAVVKNICDRILVMYLGKICEVAPSDVLHREAAHPYSSLLIDSIPQITTPGRSPDRIRDSGELPSTVNPPSGCRFRTRCPRADQRCSVEEPLLREIGSGHFVACHHPAVTPEGGAQPVTSVSSPD
jgi:peptide/nickel transport system ATP-binding protein